MPSIRNYAFIDGANLHLTYENLNWKIDYQKLFVYLKNRLNVSVAYYFLGNIKENRNIYTDLESWGYTLVLKDPTRFVTDEEYCPYCDMVIAPEIPRYKSDCDSLMTLQIMSVLNLFDKAVIITSDGDFDNLVKKLLQQDKLRLVFAPCREGCSGLLISAAMGRIAFIDDYKNQLEKI
jgi:uncharacterized LabA/DUF88 family protein